jgi:hypothetical protein
MPFFLWTLTSLVAYACGLVLVTLVTPRLLTRSFYEEWFMGFAVLDVIGGMLAFGAVAVTFAIFSGAFAIRVLDFLLLLGMLIVSARMSYRSFRPRKRVSTYRPSRIGAGIYCLLLFVTALYCMGLLFVPAR